MSQAAIVESHPTEFFRDLVRNAMSAQGVESREETEYYLVDLLRRLNSRRRDSFQHCMGPVTGLACRTCLVRLLRCFVLPQREQASTCIRAGWERLMLGYRRCSWQRGRWTRLTHAASFPCVCGWVGCQLCVCCHNLVSLRAGVARGHFRQSAPDAAG